MNLSLFIFGGLGPWRPLEIAVGLVLLAILLAFGFAGDRLVGSLQNLAVPARLLLPLGFTLAYLLIAITDGMFRWRWLVVYIAVPLAVSLLLWLGTRIDPQQRGTWCDYAVLAILGLAVDLRWFEPAWPAHLHGISKILLLDTGLYGFLIIRGLTGCGIDFCTRWRDWKIGMRELLLYMPIVIPLGLGLDFLHWHPVGVPWWLPLAWLYTIVFIAIPEEIFFRAWMQNLIERRTGRVASLIITSILFGLSHFNKHTAQFNWRYVLLAAIAGIFYGRAWRAERRMAASAITHATVDTLWSIWLR